MKIKFRPEAEHDVETAARWYEEREAGLGREVIDEIDAALRRVASGPERYPVAYRELRRARVRRFPYSIYFTERDGDMEIVAVLHQRRDLKPLADRMDR